MTQVGTMALLIGLIICLIALSAKSLNDDEWDELIDHIRNGDLV